MCPCVKKMTSTSCSLASRALWDWGLLQPRYNVLPDEVWSNFVEKEWPPRLFLPQSLFPTTLCNTFSYFTRRICRFSPITLLKDETDLLVLWGTLEGLTANSLQPLEWASMQKVLSFGGKKVEKTKSMDKGLMTFTNSIKHVKRTIQETAHSCSPFSLLFWTSQNPSGFSALQDKSHDDWCFSCLGEGKLF